MEQTPTSTCKMIVKTAEMRGQWWTVKYILTVIRKRHFWKGLKKQKQKTNPTIFQFNEIEKLVKRHRPPHSLVSMLLQKLIFFL